MHLNRILAVTFCVAFAGAATAQATSDKASARLLFKEAFDRAQANDAELAISLFERGLEMDDTDLKAQRLLAELLQLDPARSQSAKKAWQRLLEISPKDTPENIVAAAEIRKLEALVKRPVWRVGRTWQMQTVRKGSRPTVLTWEHRVTAEDEKSYKVTAKSLNTDDTSTLVVAKDTFAVLETVTTFWRGVNEHYEHLSFPLVVGKAWNVSVRTTNGSGSVSNSYVRNVVDRYESVTTPKGVDNAFVITATAPTSVHVCWFSLLVGDCVRRDSTYNGNGDSKITTISFMTAFSE